MDLQIIANWKFYEIIFTGSVTESELDLLYLNCKLFVFSISEGFWSSCFRGNDIGRTLHRCKLFKPDLVGDAAVKFNAIDHVTFRKENLRIYFEFQTCYVI